MAGRSRICWCQPSPDSPAIVTGRVLPITATRYAERQDQRFRSRFRRRQRRSTRSISAACARRFSKRFRLEGSGDRSRWTELVARGHGLQSAGGAALAHPHRDSPRASIATCASRGTTPTARASPAPDARRRAPSDRVVTGTGAACADGSSTVRPSEPGRSRFRLNLPAARLPIVALELERRRRQPVARRAGCSKPGLVGEQAQPQVIGKARLVRVMQRRCHRRSVAHSDSTADRAAARSGDRRWRQSAARSSTASPRSSRRCRGSISKRRPA